MPTPYHVTSACGSCFTSSLANSNSSVFFFNSKRHVKYAGTYAVLNSSSRRILCHGVSNLKPISHRCALPNCFHTFYTWLDSPQTCSEPTESLLGFALHPRYSLIHRRAPLCFELQRPHVDVNTTNGARLDLAYIKVKPQLPQLTFFSLIMYNDWKMSASSPH